MQSNPANPIRPDKRQHAACCLLLVLLTAVSYARVFSADFIHSYDDEMYITLNPFVSQGITIQGVLWSLTSFVSGNWHPLTWWSHMADVSLYGLNPAGHHATSLILHVINAVLLYSFLNRATGFIGRSFLVAALFSLHPLHVESVAWVAERKDIISTLFALAALHEYLSYTKNNGKAHYLAVTALLCLSLMAKPMLVTFPFLLLLLDHWPLERHRSQPLKELIAEKLPLFIPVIGISIITVVAQDSAGALRTLADDTVQMRVFNALNAYAVYLRKLVAPYDLASFYPYATVSGFRVLVAAVVLGIATFVVWRFRAGRPWLATGWIWYVIMLIPVIGIIRVGNQAYADRYTYLPIVGVLIMAVWGGSELLGKSGTGARLGYALSAFVITACCLLTLRQTGYWKDASSLYTRELAVTPGNWHAHFGLGNEMAKRQLHSEAITHYYAVLAANPASADTYNNLGASLRQTGKGAAALPYLFRAIELNPAAINAYFNLALTLAELGNIAAAIDYLQAALQIDPQFREARAYLDHLRTIPPENIGGR